MNRQSDPPLQGPCGGAGGSPQVKVLLLAQLGSAQLDSVPGEGVLGGLVVRKARGYLAHLGACGYQVGL